MIRRPRYSSGGALERLLSLYEQKQDEKRITYDDIDNMDYDSFEFQTEKSLKNVSMVGWKDGSVDVYGSNDDYVIVIENKVTASEQVRGGIGQTEMYYDEIERKKESGQKVVYIFVTPDPTQKPRSSHFVQITYQEIYDRVICPCIDNPNISSDSRYKKYQQVFDEIFMSVEVYAETPDASVQRKVITFDSLVA